MIIRILYQPYPKLVRPWNVVLLVSAFVGLFMLTFEPFGLSQVLEPEKTWLLLGYGVVTALVLAFNLVVLPQVFSSAFKASGWTVLKEILFLLLILFCVGAGNYFYTDIYFDGIGDFFTFQIYTLSIGILPVITITLVNQILKLKQNLERAKDLNQILDEAEPLGGGRNIAAMFQSESGKVELQLDLGRFLFIASEGNYVKVYFLSEEGVSSKLIRNTVRDMDEQLSGFEQLIRCHRAFVVNLSQVKEVSGNAQGLVLFLKHSDLSVPVSRNYVKDIRTALAVSH